MRPAYKHEIIDPKDFMSPDRAEEIFTEEYDLTIEEE